MIVRIEPKNDMLATRLGFILRFASHCSDSFAFNKDLSRLLQRLCSLHWLQVDNEIIL